MVVAPIGQARQLYVKGATMATDNQIKKIEYVRDRLVDLTQGDETVDIGILAHMLNKSIEKLGGEKKQVSAKSFFVKIDEG